MRLYDNTELNQETLKNLMKPCNAVYNIQTNKNICIPELDLYVNEPLCYGNSKLYKDIAIFDLLAVSSCANHHLCANTCYAKRAQIQYPAVWNKRLIHTYLALYNTPLLYNLIKTQLNKNKKNYIRIHSSGDFITNNYTEMWIKLANTFTTTKFYFYTKIKNNYYVDELASLPNVNRVDSILPDGSINYGSKEYVKIKSKILNIPICPTNSDKYVVCGKTCFYCMNNKYVLFERH